MLVKLMEIKGKNWDKPQGAVLLACRTSPHSSTGETPFFLMYGQHFNWDGFLCSGGETPDY